MVAGQQQQQNSRCFVTFAVSVSETAAVAAVKQQQYEQQCQQQQFSFFPSVTQLAGRLAGWLLLGAEFVQCRCVHTCWCAYLLV